MSESFDFARLPLEGQQIRLARLQHQPDSSSELRCELTVHELDSNLNFTALSYTWGEPSRNRILINGNEFWIYDNLFDFLSLQSKDSDFCQETYLWVDQLCIDQTNDLERGHQVKLMSKIYSSASRTIIWLGLPGKGNVMGGDIAAKVMRSIQELLPSSKPDTEFDEPPEELLRLKDPNPAIDVLCQYPIGLLKVLSLSEYWDRVWIIQEVLLSKQPVLQCGLDTIEWVFIDRCLILTGCYHVGWLGWFDYLKSELVIGLGKFGSLIRRRDMNGLDDQNGPDWPRALHMSTTSRCARTHDRIFGMLGIVKEELRFPPDYSMSLRALFEKVMEVELKQIPNPRTALLQLHGEPGLHKYKNALYMAESLGLEIGDEIVAILMRILARIIEQDISSGNGGEAIEYCPSGLKLMASGT